MKKSRNYDEGKSGIMGKNGTPLIVKPWVISSGWSFSAYDIVRALGIEGVKTAVASSQPNDVAFYSRNCLEKIILPDFEEENYPLIAEILMETGRQQKDRPVLYYTSDPELHFVRRYRTELLSYYRMNLPSEDLLKHLVNKALFPELARKFGLPTPYTITVHDVEEVNRNIGSVEFPCIVKPAFSQDWVWDNDEQRQKFGPYKKALRRFETQEALLDFCQALPKRQAGFLIQSYIDGRDETITSFHGYFDEHSKCLGYFMGEKIRTYPAHTGGSAYVRTILNEDLAHKSIEYLHRVGFCGVVKIDYKWDERRGEFRILEVNPRYNLWELLGAYCGMNLAYIAYRHQIGDPVVVPQQYANDARLMFFKQDLRGYMEGYRKTHEWSIGQYMRSLLKAKYYRVCDHKDTLPFLISSVDFVKRNFQKLMGTHRADHHPVKTSYKKTSHGMARA